MNDLPVVSTWTDTGSGWAKTGEVGEYESLTFAPAFLGVGSWTMTLPYGDQAQLLARDGLVTIDWRGKRSTWRIGQPHPMSDDETGETVLEVSGVGAISMLGWEEAWPDPTTAITSQPTLSETDPAPYNTDAETVVTQLVATNLRDRAALPIVVPFSQHRGSRVQARPQMDNLLELCTNLAKLGGIGVDLGLVGTSTRADLTLQVWTPADKTRSVLLTSDAGTLDKWEQVDTEPTATRAIVAGAGTGGMDRVMQIVTTPDSEAAAVEWGGHRTIFVDGPSSFDPDELRQAGEQALLDGAATRTLVLTSSESDGQQAFADFNVGDKATAEVLTGATVQDVITSIEVTVDVDSGVEVVPTFGNPSATDAQLDLAEQLGELKRAVRHQERK